MSDRQALTLLYVTSGLILAAAGLIAPHGVALTFQAAAVALGRFATFAGLALTATAAFAYLYATNRTHR